MRISILRACCKLTSLIPQQAPDVHCGSGGSTGTRSRRSVLFSAKMKLVIRVSRCCCSSNDSSVPAAALADVAASFNVPFAETFVRRLSNGGLAFADRIAGGLIRPVRFASVMRMSVTGRFTFAAGVVAP